jgi:replicative DNA helicase
MQPHALSPRATEAHHAIYLSDLLYETGRAYRPGAAAERGILGLCMRYGPLYVCVARRIDASFFYEERHRILWRTMGVVWARDKDIDPVLLIEELVASGTEPQIRTTKLPSALAVVLAYAAVDALPLYVDRYIDALARAKAQRQAVEVLGGALEEGRQQPSDVVGFLGRVTGHLERVAEEASAMELNTLPDRLDGYRELMEGVLDDNAAEALRGISTGYERLDREIIGWVPGQVVTLAGRPGSGKSAFAQCTAICALEAGKRVVLYNLEAPSREVWAKLMASRCRVPYQSIARGALDPQERMRMGRGIAIVPKWDVRIIGQDDCPNDPDKLLEHYANLVEREGPADLVIIDHAHRFQPRGYRPSEMAQAFLKVTWTFKKLAAHHDCCALVLAHASRELDKSNRPPSLGDVKWGGSFEEDSHVLMFSHDPNETDEGNGRSRQLIVRKNRNGAKDLTLDFEFDGPHLTWRR